MEVRTDMVGLGERLLDRDTVHRDSKNITGKKSNCDPGKQSLMFLEHEP